MEIQCREANTLLTEVRLEEDSVVVSTVVEVHVVRKVIAREKVKGKKEMEVTRHLVVVEVIAVAVAVSVVEVSVEDVVVASVTVRLRVDRLRREARMAVLLVVAIADVDVVVVAAVDADVEAATEKVEKPRPKPASRTSFVKFFLFILILNDVFFFLDLTYPTKLFPLPY
jgi:hypothetical protein